MRFSTLEAMCEVLECKPGDLVDYLTDEEYEEEKMQKELAKKRIKASRLRR